MKTQIFPADSQEIHDWLATLPLTRTVTYLLSPERFWGYDEVVVGFVRGRIVGIACLAPYGETGSGPPSVAALYVEEGYRNRGFGTAILTAAIRRLDHRGFQWIEVNCNGQGRRVVERIPQSLRGHLIIHNRS